MYLCTVENNKRGRHGFDSLLVSIIIQPREITCKTKVNLFKRKHTN
jgi:hypothetical protein